MRFIFLIFTLCNFCLVFVHGAKRVSLSLTGAPPYKVGVTYKVSWTVTTDSPNERKLREFFIVKERAAREGEPPGRHLSPSPVPVKLGLSSTGTADVVFNQNMPYKLKAFNNRKGNQEYEGDLGETPEVTVFAQDVIADSASSEVSNPLPITSVSSPDSGATSTPSVTTPSPSDTAALTSEMAGNTKGSASRTATIVGAVLGSAIGICLLIILLFVLVIRPRRRKTAYSSQISSIFIQSPNHSNHPELGVARSPFAAAWPSDEKVMPYISPPASVKSSRDRKPSTPLGFDPDSKKLPSIFTEATPPVRFVPLTDRQMELQERIHNLKAKLIPLSEDSLEFEGLIQRINVLELLQNSDWALDRTDEIPPGLLD